MAKLLTRPVLLFLPFVVGTIFLTVLPALATIGLAFTRLATGATPAWVGLDNFAFLAANDVARLSLFNSMFFVAMAVPLRMGAALSLALLLQHRSRPFGLARTAVVLPTFIPEAAYALIGLWLFNPVYGPVNGALNFVGLPLVPWLSEPLPAQWALIWLAAFQLGEGFIVLLAALRTIPLALYEAAKVDGATIWQSFWAITMPQIAPWFLLLTIRDMFISLQNTFAPSYIMTYGGPDYATMLAPLLTYEIAFDFYNDLGLAAAFLVVTVLLISTLMLGLWLVWPDQWRGEYE